MDEHGVDPHDFLDFVHDIDFRPASADPARWPALERLPGRKLRLHQWRRAPMPAACSRRSASTASSTSSTTSTPWTMSQARPAWLCGDVRTLRHRPACALFVEDMARNLEPAKSLGMTTVWIDNGSERGDHGADPAFIDYHIDRYRPLARMKFWRKVTHERRCSDDRASMGGARPRSTPPPTASFARPSTRRSPRSTAARRGSRRRATASWRSING